MIEGDSRSSTRTTSPEVFLIQANDVVEIYLRDLQPKTRTAAFFYSETERRR